MKSLLFGGAILCTLLWYACDAKLNQTITRKAIDKPIAKIKQPIEKMVFHADSGGVFILKSGTTIKFPKSAFVDKQGNAIKDIVNIEFEEYHKTSEIFLSGINMMFNQNGEEQPFESAGMFKIEGRCNGQDIEIAEDKNVRIDLASLKKEDGYDFFIMNEESGQWTMIDSAPVNKDTSSFIASTDFQNTSSVNQNKALRLPEIADPNATVLDLDIDYSQYPQLKNFYGIAWQIDDKSKDAEKWLTGDWDEVKLISTGDGINDFQLSFKKYQVSSTVAVKPVVNKEVKLKMEQEYAAAKKEQELLILAQNQRRLELYDNQAKFIRSLQINGFGIYNCDRVIKYDAPVVINATFKLGGNDIQRQTFYLLSNDNSSVSQYSNNFKFDNERENRLVFILSNNKIGFVDASTLKEVGAIASKNGIAPYQTSIDVKPLDVPFDNPEELAAILDKI